MQLRVKEPHLFRFLLSMEDLDHFAPKRSTEKDFVAPFFRFRAPRTFRNHYATFVLCPKQKFGLFRLRDLRKIDVPESSLRNTETLRTFSSNHTKHEKRF